jgi:RNA polymerase sigma-70 factor (ECF subfamily)
VPTPPSDAEVRRIYIDALERAVQHAGIHVSRDEALDVGHHVASALVKRQIAGGSPPIDSVDGFIHRAVLNRLREIWRASRRRKAVEQMYHEERAAVAPAWARPDGNLESRELHDAIDAAIAQLPITQRQVFLLVRRDQLTYKEVAVQLQITVGTVHTHLSRANATLRKAVAAKQAGDAEPNRSRLTGIRP